MDYIIGGCVICTQNLYHSKQCPACRAHTSPKHIVKRLYFADCFDEAIVNATENATAVTDANHIATVNESFLSSPTQSIMEERDGFYVYHNENDESYHSSSDYGDNSGDADDHEQTWSTNDDHERTWSTSERSDDDDEDDDDSSVITSGDSDSTAESEIIDEDSEEDVEHHGIISNIGNI
uniref:Uncharacterized protein n=1 Tax=Setaria digitata TaxID=48799 RepID=A0A915PJZ9_9BILA